MQLNDKDKTQYLCFLEQIKTIKDIRLQIYSQIINDYIINNYKSFNNNIFELVDFIQEAYFLLYNKHGKIKDFNKELDNLYNLMNSYGKKTTDKIVQINYKKYIDKLEDNREKEILKAVLLNEDLEKKRKELNISKIELKILLIKIYTELKKYIRFKEILNKPSKK